MREIKFRAKTINTNEWIDSMTISKGTIKRKRDCVYFEADTGVIRGVIPETVGEYTGLPFNICEGDIIKPKNRDSIFVVLWNEHHCCFSTFSKYEYGEIISGDALSKLNTLANKGNIRREWILEYEMSPIGNIHDNASLLV